MYFGDGQKKTVLLQRTVLNTLMGLKLNSFGIMICCFTGFNMFKDYNSTLL